MPAELTASTARFPSCWPWSISPGSTPVSRRPARSVVMPASRTTRRSDRALSFRPRTAAAPGEQLLQGVGRRLAVVVQQPDPLGTARRAADGAGGRALQGAGDGGA